MNITTTDIKDQNFFDGSTASRLLLMDEIITNFTPLVSEEIERKLKQCTENLADRKKLKEEVLKNRKILKRYQQIHEKENVKSELLNKIEYLYESNVLYGQNRQQAKEILLAISENRLDKANDFKNRLDIMIKNIVKK